MNLEKYMQPTTVQKIYEHYEASRENGHRPHLGGSQIGNPCSRALWYQFRHASSHRALRGVCCACLKRVTARKSGSWQT